MSSQSESIGPQRRLSGEERGAGNQQGKEFLALFSHELRNSLGAIRGATHVLRAGALGDSAQAKARALIERQVDQMTRLVEDLLDVSRIGNGQLRLQRDRIDVRTVLAHSVQAVELTMQQRNHRMTTSFPDAPVWLLADAVQVGAGIRESARQRRAVHRGRRSCGGLGETGQPTKPSFAFVTPALELLSICCLRCSTFTSRRIPHRETGVWA